MTWDINDERDTKLFPLPENWIWKYGSAVLPEIQYNRRGKCVDPVDGEGNIYVESESWYREPSDATYVPAEVYAAILRKAGWKVEPPP